MRIITTDDESAALRMLTNAVKDVCADAEVVDFSDANKAYEYATEHPIDIAFLDIQMRQMSGIELAKKLRGLYPKLNVIFVTGFAEYGIDAVQLHASGYLEKPVDEDDVREALDNLLYPIEEQSRLYIQTFGTFEVFYQGKPVKFERAKAKELLAYLVAMRGASSTRREISAILFEEDEYTRTQQGYFSKIYQSLNRTLKEIGAQDMIRHDTNFYAVDMDAIDCDMKEFFSGEAHSKEKFTGRYMEQYSWSEEFIGIFF